MSKAIYPLILCVFLIADAVLTSNGRAASFAVTADPKRTCSAIEIDGDIQAGDYEKFAAKLKEAIAVAPLRRLYLNSGGGRLLTALAITDLIRNTVPNLETIVQPRRRCNSACIVVLTVGSKRNVSAEAELIVHQVFNERTGERDAEMTTRLGQYLALNGMPPDVIWTLSDLKPEELLTITPSNAKRLGFGGFNFYGSTNPPATPQCSWEGFTLRSP